MQLFLRNTYNQTQGDTRLWIVYGWSQTFNAMDACLMKGRVFHCAFVNLSFTNTRLLAHFTHKGILAHDHGTFRAVGCNEPLQTFVPSAIIWYGVPLEQNIPTENCIMIGSVICIRLEVLDVTARLHSRRPGKATVNYEYKGMANHVTPFFSSVSQKSWVLQCTLLEKRVSLLNASARANHI